MHKFYLTSTIEQFFLYKMLNADSQSVPLNTWTGSSWNVELLPHQNQLGC